MSAHVVIDGCGCDACITRAWIESGARWFHLSATRMTVCAICGNKRCPHATSHRLECTGSNEPGQRGSRFA